ncbi:unnamed protein product [Lactuca saligna]|uniref:Translation initiation factor IF-1, chloroplastic n=1 Tax=Lactuca saligna TaxID=75948 RepID=A0AA35YHS5_LACSI|nr:unnamed protein product [Lactuca saligna]
MASTTFGTCSWLLLWNTISRPQLRSSCLGFLPCAPNPSRLPIVRAEASSNDKGTFGLGKSKSKPSDSGEQKWVAKGLITESLPNGMFWVRLENGDMVLGYVSGKIRRNSIRMLPGDKVKIEVSRYDSTRGRIVYRIGVLRKWLIMATWNDIHPLQLLPELGLCCSTISITIVDSFHPVYLAGLTGRVFVDLVDMGMDSTIQDPESYWSESGDSPIAISLSVVMIYGPLAWPRAGALLPALSGVPLSALLGIPFPVLLRTLLSARPDAPLPGDPLSASPGARPLSLPRACPPTPASTSARPCPAPC